MIKMRVLCCLQELFILVVNFCLCTFQMHVPALKQGAPVVGQSAAESYRQSSDLHIIHCQLSDKQKTLKDRFTKRQVYVVIRNV